MESSTNQNRDEKYILAKPTQLGDLFIPIQLNKSVQFTVIDVSKDFIWCGSNRASLYVFDRYMLKHVYLIPTTSNSVKDCALTHVAAYKSQQLCASANSRGEVAVSRIQSGTSVKPESVEVLSLSHSVTQLVWHTDSPKLYIGDDTGVIHVCSILTSKVIPRTVKLCTLDSCIVQLHFRDTVLLASTLTKCVLYCTERKTFSDVGTKPRQGLYGAVLLPVVSKSEDCVPNFISGRLECCCARPGFRLWRANTEGKVLTTLNFKRSMAECRQSSIVDWQSNESNPTSAPGVTQKPAANSFTYLYTTRDNLLLSIVNNSLYIVDPVTSRVVISTQIDTEVIDCCVQDKSIYLLMNNDQMWHIELTTLLEHIESLLDTDTISGAIQLCLDNQEYVLKNIMLLVRIHEIVSPHDPLYQSFMSVFGSKRAEYQSTIDGRSSRSNTVSSVTSSRSLRSNSVTSLRSANSMTSALSAGSDTSYNTAKDAGSIDWSNSYFMTKPANEKETSLPCNTTGGLSSSYATDALEELDVPNLVVGIVSPQATSAEEIGANSLAENNSLGEAVQPVQDVSLSGRAGTVSSAVGEGSPASADGSFSHLQVKSELQRVDSSKSLMSVDSFLSARSTGSFPADYSRRGSVASMSSYEPNEEFSENIQRKSNRSGKIRVSTIEFPPEKEDDGLILHKISRSIPIQPPSHSSLSSLDHSTSSTSSFKAKESSPSPKILLTKRELSSPGAVVDQVKDHVKDGLQDARLSKISSQAKNIISSIREKAISQPAIEKLLSNKDIPSDGDAGPASQLSEDSGSHHAFFIGDDDILMNEDMPSALTLYLDVTDRAYCSLMHPQLEDGGEVDACLRDWSQHLATLLSDYTHSQQHLKSTACSTGKALRHLTKVCPWRMSEGQTLQSVYLATMCVIRKQCHVMNAYSIDRPDASHPYSVLKELNVQGEDNFLSDKLAAGNDLENPSSNRLVSDLVYPDCTVRVVAQFISTFWFLMDKELLCKHIEYKSAAVSSLSEQLWSERKKLWDVVISCLIESRSESLEWKPVYHPSLFSESNIRQQVLKKNNREDLWLYIYLLIRQQKFDDAISVAVCSHTNTHPFHVMYCLQSTCKDGDLECPEAHKVFSKYAQSLIDYQDVSHRSKLVCLKFKDDQVLRYLLQSLQSVWELSHHKEAKCDCGMPSELPSNPSTNHQTLSSNILSLLDDAFGHLDFVKSMVLLMGGSRALLKQKIRDNQRKDVIRLLLLSDDIADLRLTLGNICPTKEDCLFLFEQRARQEGPNSMHVYCTWCGSVRVTNRPLLLWDALADLVLEWLGPLLCLEVLSECSLPVSSVSRKFFSKCADSHQTEVKSSQVVADVINSMEQFLWTNQSSDRNVHPALYLLMEKEAQAYKQIKEGQPITDQQHTELLEMSNSLKHHRSLRTIADGDIHWGRAVSLDTECYHCGLPLLHDKMDVTVFQCGHVTHQHCLSSSFVCSQCPSTN